MLDAGERQSLVVLRSLGRRGVRIGAVEHRHAPAFDSRWCTVAETTADGAVDRSRFVADLLDVIDRRRPDVVIPARDGTIETLRAHRTQFEGRTRLALACEAALAAAVEKPQTYRIAADLGVAVPRTEFVVRSADLAAALREVGTPAVVKPPQSWVQRGQSGERVTADPAASLDQAQRAADRLIEICGSAVVQQWVGGTREAISTVFARGRFWAWFAQIAYRMHPPLGGSSIVRESISPPSDLVAASEVLVEAIGLEGYCEVEFRRDVDGTPYLMEINPRLSASVEIAVRAGVDFPGLIYAWALDESLTACREARTGVRMRWLGGDIRWLWRTLRGQGLPDHSPPVVAARAFLADTLRPAYYDYLVLDDLRPSLTACLQFVRLAAAKSLGSEAGRRRDRWRPRQ
jgi:predicted ATP-grasp superfamily ATP-dependent carboligase